jgi:hypothetical protein
MHDVTRPRITLLESIETRLRKFLESDPLGAERAAVVLFRRLSRAAPPLPDSDRYIAVDVVPFEDAWVSSSSRSHIGFALAPLRELLRRCADEHLVFGFAHNHPTAYPAFS